MATDETGPTPPRDEAVPGHYAVHVTAERLQVWQYREQGLDPDGDWHHVETLPHEDETRLSFDWARPLPPTDDGYWVFCRAYDCQRGCGQDDEGSDASFLARRRR